MPAVLAAPWLGGLCIAAAWVMGWCTLVGGRTWTAVFTGPFMPWLMFSRVAGWLGRARSDLVPAGANRSALPKVGRVVAVVAITGVLLAVFGGLFAAADPAFAHVLGSLVPALDVGDAVAHVLVFGTVLGFVLAGGYLMRFAPRLDAMAPKPMKALPRWEWALPLGVLDGLFVAFVVVQATVLFGGHRHVLETEGLTYAEYARQGFWQLLWVSALTLVVLSGVIRVAGRVSAADRRLLRILVGTTCLTSVVVVISAIHRMSLYQEAYGFSVQRLMVIAIELWLGAVFVLIAVGRHRDDGAVAASRSPGDRGVDPARRRGAEPRAVDRRPQRRPLRADRAVGRRLSPGPVDGRGARARATASSRCATARDTVTEIGTPGTSSTCRDRGQATMARPPYEACEQFWLYRPLTPASQASAWSIR